MASTYSDDEDFAASNDNDTGIENTSQELLLAKPSTLKNNDVAPPPTKKAS